MRRVFAMKGHIPGSLQRAGPSWATGTRGVVNQSVKLINTVPQGGIVCDVPSCSNLMQKLIGWKGGRADKE